MQEWLVVVYIVSMQEWLIVVYIVSMQEWLTVEHIISMQEWLIFVYIVSMQEWLTVGMQEWLIVVYIVSSGLISIAKCRRCIVQEWHVLLCIVGMENRCLSMYNILTAVSCISDACTVVAVYGLLNQGYQSHLYYLSL